MLADGFAPGQQITVSGSGSNEGTYEVAFVEAKVLMLKEGEELTDETASDVTVRTGPTAIPGLITAGNDVDVSAFAGDQIFTFSLAGSIATVKDKAKPDENAQDSAKPAEDGKAGGKAASGKGKFGVGVSADVSINAIDAHTLAYVDDGVTVNSRDLRIVALTAGKPMLTGEPALTFAPTNTITRSAGSWMADGFRPGQAVTIDDSANNSGTYRVVAVTDSVLTVTGPALQAETSRDVTVTGGPMLNLSRDLYVTAKTTGKILSIAASGSGAGKVGIAGQVTINEIDNDTSAYVGNASDVQAAGGAGGGTVGIAGTAGVYVLDVTTRAVLGPETGTASATVDARGSVLVAASDENEMDIIAGNVSGGGTASIGASAGVTVINKETEALIAKADVTAHGGGSGVEATTGEFTVSTEDDSFLEAEFNPQSAVHDSAINLGFEHGLFTGQAVVYRNGGGNSIGTLENDGVYYAIVDPQPPTKLKLGSTKDDAEDGIFIELVPGVASGTNHTISPAETREVAAPGAIEADFSENGQNDVEDESLTAQRTSEASTTTVVGVAVTAVNKDDIEVIGVCGGAAGTVAINVTGGVVVIDTCTSAYIRGDATVSAVDPCLAVRPSVFVTAGNDFYSMNVVASASGAGAGITILNKDTQAFIGPYSVVDAAGNTPGLAVFKDLDASGAFTADADFHGVAVQAVSTEDVFTVAAAAAGGTFFGLAGGVAVETVDSDTRAYIGDGAKVNQDPTVTPNDKQSVNVSAVNVAEVLVIAGGSVAIANIKSHTQAYINKGATVSAGGDILVAAGLVEDTEGLAFAGQAGIVALGAQVVVFNDASTQTAYVADGAKILEAGTLRVTATADRDLEADAKGGGIGLVTAGAAVSSAEIHGDTLASIGATEIGQEAGKSVGNVEVTATSTDTVDTETIAVSAGIYFGASGSVALSEVNPEVQASIDTGAKIKADDVVLVRSRSTGTASADALGINVAGLLAAGASIADADVIGTNTARVDAEKLEAANLTITATTTENADAETTSAAGAMLAGSGSVPTAKTASNTQAFVGDRTEGDPATVTVSGNIHISATSTPQASAEADGINAGLLAVGVSDATATVSPEVAAYVGKYNNVTAGQPITDDQGGPNDIDVSARTDLWNKTAFPVETDPEARGEVIQNNTVVIGSGALVRSVADVNLIADEGSVYVRMGSLPARRSRSRGLNSMTGPTPSRRLAAKLSRSQTPNCRTRPQRRRCTSSCWKRRFRLRAAAALAC